MDKKDLLWRAAANQRLAAANHFMMIEDLKFGDIRKAIHRQKEAQYFAEIAANQVASIR